MFSIEGLKCYVKNLRDPWLSLIILESLWLKGSEPDEPERALESNMGKYREIGCSHSPKRSLPDDHTFDGSAKSSARGRDSITAVRREVVNLGLSGRFWGGGAFVSDTKEETIPLFHDALSSVDDGSLCQLRNLSGPGRDFGIRVFAAAL
jgi:hypothetical protein